MKRLTVGLLTILSTQIAMSQVEFGINVKAGIGEMKKINNDYEMVYLNKIESEPAFSWGVSFVTSKKVHPLFTLSSEIGYHLMKGVENESYDVILLDDGAISNNTARTVRNAHYITLPISIDFQVDEKITIGGGLSGNYLVTNDRLTEYHADGTPNGVDGGGNDLNKFDFGLHAQTSFRLTERFSLTGKANFGMMNLRPSDIRDAYSSYSGLPQHHSFETKNRQYTIGLTYFFN